MKAEYEGHERILLVQSRESGLYETIHWGSEAPLPTQRKLDESGRDVRLVKIYRNVSFEVFPIVRNAVEIANIGERVDFEHLLEDSAPASSFTQARTDFSPD